MLDEIKSGLVVSCQALENEPLHGADTMKKMALAAYEGGAVGIRANGTKDIQAIKSTVHLPIIGIIKKEYQNSEVFITPTFSEVDQLISTGVEIIAIDATNRARPNHMNLKTLFTELKLKYPQQMWMADCSSLNECIQAADLGFDCIGTTLYGYTEDTQDCKLYDDDFKFLKDVISQVNVPVIAEGNILTPKMASTALKYGAHSVVAGGAITRPQQITKRFVEEIQLG